MPVFQLHKSYTGAVYYKHELLSTEPVFHGFFTRIGGKSKGVFSHLNTSLRTADLEDNVIYNRQIVKNSLIHDERQLITLHQSHGNKVVSINSEEIKNGVYKDTELQADGLVSKDKNVLLGILTADCAPLLMADVDAGVIGACHAGWKGAASGIIENTINAMCNIGAKKKNIRCVIGPSISQNSYQVGADFRDIIIEKTPSAKNLFMPDTEASISSGINKFLFDLPGFCCLKLEDAHIKQYDIIDIDTYQNHDLLFSYRLSCHQKEDDYGRQISVIGIR